MIVWPGCRSPHLFTPFDIIYVSVFMDQRGQWKKDIPTTRQHNEQQSSWDKKLHDYLCILDIRCSSMSSLPRKPFANGLFSIFSWVIWNDKNTQICNQSGLEWHTAVIFINSFAWNNLFKSVEREIFLSECFHIRPVFCHSFGDSFTACLENGV